MYCVSMRSVCRGLLNEISVVSKPWSILIKEPPSEVSPLMLPCCSQRSSCVVSSTDTINEPLANAASAFLAVPALPVAATSLSFKTGRYKRLVWGIEINLCFISEVLLVKASSTGVCIISKS